MFCMIVKGVDLLILEKYERDSRGKSVFKIKYASFF